MVARSKEMKAGSGENCMTDENEWKPMKGQVKEIGRGKIESVRRQIVTRETADREDVGKK